MKKIKLFLAACAAMVGLSASAQTDAQYDAAIAAITDGNYGIVAVVNGQTLVLKSDGYLTDDAYGVGTFAVSQKAGGEIKGTGFRIASTGRFTNGGDSNNVITSKNHLAVQTTQDRATFECQVLYLNDEGYCAVRSINSSSTFWGGTAYWDVVDDNDGDYLPNATYSFDNVPYVWKFVPEADFEDVLSSVSTARKTRILAQLNSYKNDAAYTNDKTNLTNAIAAIEAATTIEEIHNATSDIATIINEFSYANATYPIDRTSVITNPGFETSGGAGWSMEASNKNLYGGAATNHNAESWQSAFTLSQTVTVPNGYYRLRAQAALTDYTNAYDGANYPVVYAGDQTATFTEMDALDRGTSMTQLSQKFSGNKYYTAWTPIVVVTDGQLTIGVKGTRTNTWCIFDNFQLQYLGPIDLSIYKDELAAAVARAEAVEGTVPTATYALLASVVADKNQTYDDEDDYSAAITAVNNAVNTYASAEMVAAYAYAKKAQALYNQTDYSEKVDGAKAAFKAVLDAVDEKTTVSDVNTANAAIPAALATFMSKVEFDDGGYFNITDFFLTNADFSAGNINGWETNYKSGEQAVNIGYQGSSYSNDNVAISQFIEAWSNVATLGDGYLRQTVSGLPEGKYTLEADGISVDQYFGHGSNVDGAYLYINSDGVDFKTSMKTANGKPEHFSTEFLSPGDVDVTFGLKTESATANWLCADNFTVKFYGVDLSPYVTLLTEAVAEAEAVDIVTIPSEAGTALTAAIEEYNKEWSTSKEYSTAIAAIQSATSAAKTVEAKVTAYNAALAAANSAKENANYTNVTGIELTALESAISDTPENTEESYVAKTEALTAATATFTAAAASYDAYAAYRAETVTLFNEELAATVAAPTTAAEALVAVQNLNVAQYDKVAEAYPYSLTSKIGDFSTWTGTATVGTDRAGGTPNSLSWEHYSGVAHSYYEQDGNGYNNAGGWTIQYTKTTTLPAGSYVVKVAARSSAGVTSSMTCTATDVTISLPCAGNNTRGINVDGEASWDDEDTFIKTGGINNDPATGVGFSGAGWQWRFLPFTLTEETEVTMTFYAEASTQYQWMSIGDGELLSAENIAEDVAYNEEATNEIEAVDVANVTITRTVKVGYNTVVLPFDLTSNQVEAAFGTGAVVYSFSENSENENSVALNFTKVNAGTISANVPVLVKATAASTEQVFNGVQVVAPTEDAKVEGKYVDYVGVYALTTLDDGDFFLATKDNDAQQIFQSNGKDTAKPFRAYFQKKTAAPVKAALFIDGVATAIEGINADANNDATIFNLAGQRVNKAQKGIYIVNGKKVIVK